MFAAKAHVAEICLVLTLLTEENACLIILHVLRVTAVWPAQGKDFDQHAEGRLTPG